MVSPERGILLLREQINAAKDGVAEADFVQWKANASMAIRVAMGSVDHPQVVAFEAISYSIGVYTGSPDEDRMDREARQEGVRKAVAVMESAAVELDLMIGGTAPALPPLPPARRARAEQLVFVVHGHDSERKVTVARALEQLTGTAPIILHEQADRGRTIIEKFEDHASAVSFAVVILTADDVGGPKGGDASSSRARQNVVLEAGYFIGRLGRDRVVLLHEEGVELPSDLDGMLYVPIDAGGTWKFHMGRELRSAGMTADLNLLT